MHDPVVQAQEWLEQDPDPQTRAELEHLVVAAAHDPAARSELAERFAGKLEFGTAGLRGALGAGPTRMNRLMVRRVTAGLAWWLGPETYAVVGFDARHRSADFARDAGRIFNGAEVTALLLPRPLPTPVLAFAVRALRAQAGVMITASHNPSQDSGYKVYVGGTGPNAGSQLVPPADREISAAIDAVDVDSIDELPSRSSKVLSERVVDRYIDAILALPLTAEREIRVAYTPLHGVGGRTFLDAFARAGFPTPAVVTEQFRPDPDFPTAPMPNPEEPGVMDLVTAVGEAEGCDLVLANDPDADRLAVAVPGHRRLTGDEVGSLLAEHVLRNTTGSRVVATTIVSASQLPAIAHAYGARAVETLTGFKWLVRAGDKRERNVFSYEEALGYCIGSDADRPVADKDGISAALAIASVAAEAKKTGRTLIDLLDDQARRFGLHLTDQVPLRVEDLSTINALMRGLRSAPPTTIGDFNVDAVNDFTRGFDNLPPSDVLRYRLSGPTKARVLIRPSGTEPKLKAYLEVVLDPPGDVPAARDEGSRHLTALRGAVIELLER